MYFLSSSLSRLTICSMLAIWSGSSFAYGPDDEQHNGSPSKIQLAGKSEAVAESAEGPEVQLTHDALAKAEIDRCIQFAVNMPHELERVEEDGACVSNFRREIEESLKYLGRVIEDFSLSPETRLWARYAIASIHGCPHKCFNDPKIVQRQLFYISYDHSCPQDLEVMMRYAKPHQPTANLMYDATVLVWVTRNVFENARVSQEIKDYIRAIYMKDYFLQQITNLREGERALESKETVANFCDKVATSKYVDIETKRQLQFETASLFIKTRPQGTEVPKHAISQLVEIANDKKLISRLRFRAKVALFPHYYTDQGIHRNYKKAFEIAEEGIRRGCEEEFLYELATMFCQGLGTEKNDERAYELFKDVVTEQLGTRDQLDKAQQYIQFFEQREQQD